MSVKIANYSESLVQLFDAEKERLCKILGPDITIEHVGSSAVGIGGKNIVDILIGVADEQSMQDAKEKLIAAGYFAGNDNHPDRLFLASRKEETGANDVHIHICPFESDSYCDFIALRNYLKNNPDVAQQYFEKKKEIATIAQNDRQKYKQLKSRYVSQLLEKARKKK